MRWTDDLIAVDWGTTNRRAFRLTRGERGQSLSDECGLLAVPAGGFADAVADIRRQLGDLPMLLAGMVGSDRGWREAPYVACPAGAAELAAAIAWIDPRTGIVPGVCQSDSGGADVMRGEEVQLVGALSSGLAPATGLVCHPGTHAKWILAEDGRIVRFRTMMTGELFGLLREHSILAPMIGGEPEPDERFAAGVAQMLAGEPLLSALFRIRARSLVERGAPPGASMASGLLIGSDVAGALAGFPDLPVTLVGRPDLCALYARALELAGRESRTVDGDAAFLAGIACLARTLS